MPEPPDFDQIAAAALDTQQAYEHATAAVMTFGEICEQLIAQAVAQLDEHERAIYDALMADNRGRLRMGHFDALAFLEARRRWPF